ncbi:hypothetical protein Prudu_764S000700 [Prunus dulcis]|uniref:Ubiquitin-like protease family profile domain-containing protein n=1 Tax=Prunus dulcis TaxID=3755 RepID=A0A5H2XQD0_PRUDU|nr:hypothetical protein Prudu_764S000700 [Prunus dulcis]
MTIDKKNMLQHLDLGLYLMRKRQQQLEEVEIADWTTTDVFFMNHISTCFAENKRKKQQVGWKIRKSLLNVVNGKVPPCGMDWQNVYKVYTPFMLTKYKHWVAVMIDLVLCEIKVYDSKVSLIPDDIVKEELARYQLRFQIFSTPSTFMKKVFMQTIAPEIGGVRGQ